MVDETLKRDMPVELALLPFVESQFDPYAQSPAGASGIWQFILSTAREQGLKRNWWYDGRRDIGYFGFDFGFYAAIFSHIISKK